jgi:hypothetical protein
MINHHLICFEIAADVHQENNSVLGPTLKKIGVSFDQTFGPSLNHTVDQIVLVFLESIVS